MLPRHIQIFKEVADEISCWIALREPNNLSDPYIQDVRFVSKAMECKAKSADNKKEKKYAGLVVNPFMVPQAFTNPKAAQETWKKKFEINGQLPQGYECDSEGFVTQFGSKIHADYDLMYICEVDENGRILKTDLAKSRELHAKIQFAINAKCGKVMIQHGAEFDWEGKGCRDEEMIYSFGPKGRMSMDRSYMYDQPGKTV